MATTDDTSAAIAPPTSNAAQAAVEDWLNKQGFPLEYQTYGALWRHLAGHAAMGLHVQSKEGELREIDAHGQTTHIELSKGLSSCLRVICECKYSKDKPWVLLYGNPDPSWLVGDWIHTARSEPLNLVPTMPREVIAELQKSFHFAEGIRLAHKLVQTHSKTGGDNREFAYDSLRKITHAAWDTVDALSIGAGQHYAMVFPCLVVDGPLFGAAFDPAVGRIAAQELQFGRLCWNGCRHGTNVDVVQASALDAYAKVVGDSFLVIMRTLREIFD